MQGTLSLFLFTLSRPEGQVRVQLPVLHVSHTADCVFQACLDVHIYVKVT